MSPEIVAIKFRIFEEVKGLLATSWARWSSAEQALVERCCLDAAKLSVQALAGVDISPEKAQITAQLSNIKAGAAGSVAGTLWTIVMKIIQVGAMAFIK